MFLILARCRAAKQLPQRSRARAAKHTADQAHCTSVHPFPKDLSSRGYSPGCVTESASGTLQSTGRKPGDMLARGARRLAPAALTRHVHSAGSVTDPYSPSSRRPGRSPAAHPPGTNEQDSRDGDSVRPIQPGHGPPLVRLRVLSSRPGVAPRIWTRGRLRSSGCAHVDRPIARPSRG